MRAKFVSVLFTDISLVCTQVCSQSTVGALTTSLLWMNE